ncbi:MAG: hypothetical protein IJF38_04350 [Clostridia bacterium]|nr:hypothetical protein [Clostridia bacterium]
MYCNFHYQDTANNTCDICGEGICDVCYERYQIHDEEQHLCNSCFIEVANGRIEYAKRERKKTIRKLILPVVGFILGLILGLDICFGFGILVDEPTNIWLAPIFLPFIVPSIVVLVTGGIGMYKKDRDPRGFDIMLVIIILFKAILGSPYVFISAMAQRISYIKKANEVMKVYSDFRRIAIEQRNTEKYD